jgi:hypothetical protein
MAKLTTPEPLPADLQKAFEELRAADGLRPLTADESGTGVDRLPGGVYGFTYSPAEKNFPFFNARDLRSFESHKLKDGRVYLLGFLTAEEKDALAGSQPATLFLFPEPKGRADRLVRIPMSRVTSYVENSARLGTGFELKVSPQKE